MEQNKIIKLTLIICLAVMALFVGTTEAVALSYDKYASIGALDKNSETFAHSSLLDVPAKIIRIPQMPVSAAAVYTQKTHLLQKVVHLNDVFKSWGVYPFITDIGYRDGNPPGIESSYGLSTGEQYNESHAFGQKKRIQFLKRYELMFGDMYKALTVNSWAGFNARHHKDVGIQLTVHDVFIPDGYVRATTSFRTNPKSYFFGKGPNGSVADGSAFGFDEDSFSLAYGWEGSSSWSWELGATLSTLTVKDPRDSDKAPLSVYSPVGKDGGDILAYVAALEYDTRDSSINPKSGGYQYMSIGHYEGVNGDEFGYQKFKFDGAHYFPVGKWSSLFYFDSIVALRYGGEVNFSLGDNDMPFYDFAHIGGFNSVRGYDYNRFSDRVGMYLNCEYRYNIWAVKQLSLEGTVFADFGWVADDIGEVEFDKVKDAYGAGFRFVFPACAIAFEAAHSDEDNILYFRINPRF